MSWSKEIRFERPVTGVSLHYHGRPRVAAFEADDREKSAYQSGRQEAEAEFNERILQNRQEVQSLLGETMERVDQKIDQCLSEVFQQIPGLVINICRRVLADIEIDAEKVRAIVNDVIGDLPTNTRQVEVYLNPADLELFRSYVEDVGKNYPHCSFHEDSNLKQGDCRVESAFGSIDATIETKLKHIEDQLRS